MSDKSNINWAAKVFDATLSSKNPVEKLIEMAAECVRKNEPEKYDAIDVMLIERFIEYLRQGNIDDLNAFHDTILSFIDSDIGDRLELSKEGRKFFYRWQHLLDLCTTAVDNYHPQASRRFVEARKHGTELIELLYYNEKGIRHNELSNRLHLSPPYLSKLLREFQEYDLITREKKNKVSIIKLGISGKAYMKERMQSIPGKQPGNYTVTGNTSRAADKTFEYGRGYGDIANMPPTVYFGGPYKEEES